MLRDDAIRAGLIKPTKEDKERMNLSNAEIEEAKTKGKETQKNKKEEEAKKKQEEEEAKKKELKA